MTKIAFLGLGAMGARMAARLIAAGHDVTVWNRTPGAAAALTGATVAATPAEAARGAEVVLAMLRDDAASQAVWTGPGGALAAMSPTALAVESSTLSPGWVRDLAQQAAAQDIAFVDAPVAGSRPQAEAGELIFLAGGPDDARTRFEPIALAMGKAVLGAGETGRGAELKMMVNALLGVSAAAMADVLRYAESSGFGAERALGFLENTPVMSPIAKGLGQQILAGRHEPLFTVDLIEKDLSYMLAGVDPAPVIAAVADAFRATQAKGLGDRHISAVAEV